MRHGDAMLYLSSCHSHRFFRSLIRGRKSFNACVVQDAGAQREIETLASFKAPRFGLFSRTADRDDRGPLLMHMCNDDASENGPDPCFRISLVKDDDSVVENNELDLEIADFDLAHAFYIVRHGFTGRSLHS